MSDSSDEPLSISEEPTLDSVPCDARESPAHDSLDFRISDSPVNEQEIPKRIGDYEISDLIGSGGMGNVYLATHVRMERTVAIKMLPIERMNNAKSLDRFYGEVRTASRLLHPNIVTAFDAGHVTTDEHGDIHYMAMEYVDGVTLTDAVARGGPMEVGQAAAVIRRNPSFIVYLSTSDSRW